MTATKQHTKESIRALLAKSDLAVERAMLALYSLQTIDEQQTDDTRHDNAVGFSASNAKTGSYCARWVKSGRRLNGRFLERARRIAMQHAGQLAAIANERENLPNKPR